MLRIIIDWEFCSICYCNLRIRNKYKIYYSLFVEFEKNVKLRLQNSRSFIFGKIALVIAITYFFYICILVGYLPGIEKLFDREIALATGFVIVVGLPIMIFGCLYIMFRKHIKTILDYEAHIKSFGDLLNIFMLIFVLYVEYGFEVNPVIKIMLSNQGIVGVMYFVFLLRFIISFLALKKGEQSKI